MNLKRGAEVRDLYFGYSGKILHVSLPNKVVREELDSGLAHQFLGGLGFNAKILCDETGPGTDPLGPDNVVIVSPGALSGTGAPTACRTEVTTKSPLTGIVGTGNVGGVWGPELKHAGYDALVIRDSSPKPAYLLVDDDRVEIKDASDLWGRDSWETADILKKELGQDFSVMAIGQAGENQVRFATVIVDYQHAAGRCAAGAVLGAKKLKAIAVRGTKKPAVKWPERFEAAVLKVNERIRSYPGWKIREKTGSIGAVAPEYAAVAEQYLFKGSESFCPCPMGPYYGCTLTTEIKTGKYAGTRVTAAGLSLFSGMAKALGVSLQAAWKLKELHNRLGLDYWRGPLSFAMELYREQIITQQDTDGLELTEGNEPAIMEMLKRITYRKGFGAVLAEGSARASKIIGKGSERFLRTIKGMEFSEDPRILKLEHQLSYLTNPRGGDDLKGTHGLGDFPGLPKWAQDMDWSETHYLEWLLARLDMFEDVRNAVFGVPPKLNDLNGPMLTKWFNDLTCVYNSLGFCMFAGTTVEAFGPTHYSELFSACMGWEVTPQKLMLAGERIFNLMRMYGVREGLRREHDHWPQRFYETPLVREGGEVRTLSRERIDRMLDQYYELRGWNVRTGIPGKEKLAELQLDDLADDLLDSGHVR